EDQRARAFAPRAGGPVLREQPLQEGQGDGGGLAGAGGGTGHDVATLQDHGNGFGLAGRGRDKVLRPECAQPRVRKPESLEKHGWLQQAMFRQGRNIGSTRSVPWEPRCERKMGADGARLSWRSGSWPVAERVASACAMGWQQRVLRREMRQARSAEPG